ncbi:MAG: McrC family protein [Bacteroides sp.]|nr:McrC family protein [Bacteroides sp.]MCM1420883.1 McrC family protein [Bacteroides sp.]
MTLIQLQEQLNNGTYLPTDDGKAIIPYMDDGEEVVYAVRRGREQKEPCLSLRRIGDKVLACGSYFIGIDWVVRDKVAVQVNPKINDGFEVDYVRMLNDTLSEPANYNHLQHLVTIHFNKPSIKIHQQHDVLSVFLVTEYINMIQRLVRKGLKKSFYLVEDNLRNTIKGRLMAGRNIRQNLAKGHITDNICKYQIYDIDTPENRILKKALTFCLKQLEEYKNVFDTDILMEKARYVKPYFSNVGDDVCVRTIKNCKCNPIYKEYAQALEFAQLLLRRYSYDITLVGKQDIPTPPFWIDMSKLFELYVFHHLRRVFTGKHEVRYHVNANYQELDYLLQPELWQSPYIIDAKYKPRYKEANITKEDAREVAGYARLSKIYSLLGLDENTSLPIKCLIIYPDQEQEEHFTFNREKEPTFDRIPGYVRMYKVGIRLPIVKAKTINNDSSYKRPLS